MLIGKLIILVEEPWPIVFSHAFMFSSDEAPVDENS